LVKNKEIEAGGKLVRNTKASGRRLL